MGLLGAVAQIFFPGKKKTAKYAGNWDWSIKQPKSYRFQQILLRSKFLSKNMKVLVYGDWPDKSENILPFFTASYRNADIIPFNPRIIERGQTPLQLLFVGTLSQNKNPDISIEVAEILKNKQVKFNFHLFGDGPLRKALEERVWGSQLADFVQIHGN
jgi:glycosyltransferase involved in cell wall biosynthesis